MTEADKIWEEIKDLPIEYASLPNQTLGEHVFRLGGTENEVFLRLRSSAVIASLEDLMTKQVVVNWEKDSKGEKHKVSTPKYELQEAEGYVIVSRVEKNPQLEAHRPDVYIANKVVANIDPKVPQVTPEVKEEVKAVVSGTESVVPEGLDGQTRGGEATD